MVNVIAAKNVSENLLSLRKIAEAGFSINLDNAKFRVYSKENNKTIFEGIYEKPNWIVQFEVKKNENINSTELNDFEKYSCTACIVTGNELSEQSQTNKDELLQSSEGEKTKKNEKLSVEMKSVIGRENSEELIGTNNNESNSFLTHKIINIDDTNSLESLVKLTLEELPEKHNSEVKQSEAMLWHTRLRHVSLNYLKNLQKKEKLKHIKFDETIKDCEVCILSKMQKIPFKENRRRADRPLQIIHTDVMGPIKPSSWPGQKRFIITFVDDYSRLAKIYCLKTKDESGQALQSFLVYAQNLLGENQKVCYIRSDKGTEYTGGKFAEIMKNENKEPDYSLPATPELNGTAERFNKTIQGKIRAYMCDSGLPGSMWELAAEAAVHTYNITPHKAIKYNVPLLKFSPKARCHLEQVRRFGCIAYVKLPKTETKFSNVSIKTVLVGHTSTGYVFWHPSTRKFLESRHVRFLEKLVYRDVFKKDKTENELDNISKDIHRSEEVINFNSEKETEENSTGIEKPNSENSEIAKSSETNKPESRRRGRPKKTDSEKNHSEEKIEKTKENQTNENKCPVTRSMAKKIEDISFARYTCVIENQDTKEDELGHILLASVQKDPVTFEEAMNSEEKEMWIAAIKEELDSMKENEV